LDSESEMSKTVQEGRKYWEFKRKDICGQMLYEVRRKIRKGFFRRNIWIWPKQIGEIWRWETYPMREPNGLWREIEGVEIGEPGWDYYPKEFESELRSWNLICQVKGSYWDFIKSHI
jgi:hypothetical protein